MNASRTCQRKSFERIFIASVHAAIVATVKLGMTGAGMTNQGATLMGCFLRSFPTTEPKKSVTRTLRNLTFENVVYNKILFKDCQVCLFELSGSLQQIGDNNDETNKDNFETFCMNLKTEDVDGEEGKTSSQWRI